MGLLQTPSFRFLSSNAQDFIEDDRHMPTLRTPVARFLSSNAQDFIEDGPSSMTPCGQGSNS